MLKQKKWTLLLSSAVILLPALIGLLLWDELPARMTTHWGADGIADGWSGRPFTVFGSPLILLAAHWLCILITAKDPKNKNQSGKVFALIFWIFPALSLFSNAVMYAIAFGIEFHTEDLTYLFLGLMFILIGNYLPKCKQNHTIGVKVKWTLENEENWNATHRVSGRLWVVGGVGFLLCVVLPRKVTPVVSYALTLVLVVIPILYSWLYHRKQVKAGTATSAPRQKSKMSQTVKPLSLVFLGLLSIFVCVLLFTGSIQMQYGETSFTIEASYWDDLTVEYTAIDSVEYCEDFRPGIRTFGFGSLRLSMGHFNNDEFGAYTLYAYTGCDSCVVLHVDGKILAVSGADEASTLEIYEMLRAKTP